MMKNLHLSQFNLHQKLYNNVLEGFSDEETNQRLYNVYRINHVKYLAGHILDSHYGIAQVADAVIQPEWSDLFAGAGQSRAKDEVAYPHIQEIIANWNAIYEPIRDKLDKLPAEFFNQHPPSPFDGFAESRGEFWAFLNHHVAYHIGQIGILRRGFGKKPMRYE